MFVRIYLGLIATILASLLVSYLVFSSVNQVREQDYNEAIYSGTFKLIRGGLQRHQGPKRQEWLSIVTRLSGIDLKLISHAQGAKSNLSHDELEFEELDGGDAYLATINIDDAHFLQAEIESISEQQLRVALLLALNKLEGVGNEGIDDEIGRLQSHFSYPLGVTNLGQTDLDSTQRRRLRNGAIVVVLSSDENAVESHSVYAKLGRKSDDALVLGPIPIFVDTPTHLLVSLVILNILIIGIAAYAMVRRLEKRLNAMSSMVSLFGKGELGQRLPHAETTDSVSLLADNFNSMAERIAELIEDQKHMSQAISHELRTPIARMKFRLDILASQVESEQNSAALDKVEGLKRDLNELNSLVDEALFFQQVDSMSSLVNSSLETILLRPCIDDIAQKALTLYQDKSLKLLLEVDMPVQGNAIYLRRLFQNLIVNALRHCESRVEITYSGDSERHEVSVEDDGEGITEDLRELLFQPFQRAETSRNKKLGGYGLGLAIVRRIAILHQGDVYVDESELGGAKFVFSWPKVLDQKP